MKLLIEILLNISGWNIMSNYKMGYTLIETILVIAIVFILGGITITLSIESINDYNLSLSNCYYEDKFDNALLNLESLCTSAGIEYIEANKELNDVYSSEVIGDNITVKFKDINNDEKIKIIYLNKEIENDDIELGKGYKIGHSYFCNIDNLEDEQKWYERIIKFEIKPLLEQYWFDNTKKVSDLIERIK